MQSIIAVGGIDVNLSPDVFHIWATHYLKCRRDFQSPDTFSPVPYFLLCRAIELEIKARHLKRVTQSQVKKSFGHNLIKAYEALLDPADTILNQDEEKTLQVASVIYSNKGFEYFHPQDAATAYKRFPDLALLDSIARKLIGGMMPSVVELYI